MKKLLLITAIVFFIQIINAQTVTDIDGNVYNTVTIGVQKWMAENLKSTRYQNGDTIALITDATSWGGASTGSYCYYNNNIANAGIYGNLYNYFAVADSRNICPTGYHVSTDKEWITLTDFAGGDTIAGAKLKESGTVHWASPNVGADNAYDFTALPAGDRIITGAYFLLSNYAFFWTSTAIDNANAYARAIGNQVKLIDRGSYNKHAGYSLRCIEDPIPDSAKYFGQTPPGDKAVKFAPGIISLSNRLEGRIAFSPDGKECFFSVTEHDSSKIYYTKYVNNLWTEQKVAEFSLKYITDWPSFSANGNKLFFNNRDENNNRDIYKVERTDNGWSEPQPLLSPINSGSIDICYTETNNNTAFIISNRGNDGDWDIWQIRPQSAQAENLGTKVNSADWQYGPCISPDGSFLIFSKYNVGRSEYSDLYITFKTDEDDWTSPINMNTGGSNINTLNQSSPSLSPDCKFLFFVRHDQSGNTETMDIYWVSTSIIDTLKKIALPTVSVRKNTEQNVMLYPNPTTGQLTLSLGTSQNCEALVEIYNLQGAQVFSKTFQNTPSATIDLTGHPRGIYVVKLIADGVSYEEKIVKE